MLTFKTVGGGLTAGLTPLECVIKECGEEAGLPVDFVRARVKCVPSIFAGALSGVLGFERVDDE